MFVDKKTLMQKFFFLILVTMLFCLCLYSVKIGPKNELLYREAILNLEKYSGRTLYFSYAYINDTQDSAFFIQQFNSVVPIKFLPSLKNELKKGQFISLKGILNSNGTILPQEWHIHKKRQWKYIVALLPLIIVFYYFWRNTRLGDFSPRNYGH